MTVRGGLGLILLCIGVAGCAGVQTFPSAARPGDTIALAVGWNRDLARENVTVTIAPATGAPVTLAPGDAHVRAVVRLYPDPVSRLLVGTETQQELGVNAATYGSVLAEQVTQQDRDWWQTAIYLDLPTTLPPGAATITVRGPGGPVISQPTFLEILPGTGNPATLTGDLAASAGAAEVLASLERAEHVTVTFTGSTVPHTIQLDIQRSQGIGKPWVVNPRGDLKNISWSDNGGRLRVMLLPTHGQTLGDLMHFKFYITGGVTGLQVLNVKAYDISGRPVPGIVASIQ